MNRRPMIIASIVIVGAMLLLSAWAWVVLPADALVPIHWGAEGGPDGWADKTVGLLLPPAIAAAVATRIGACFAVTSVPRPRCPSSAAMKAVAACGSSPATN